jgi:inosine-uridine nucleoside N-ribohydrolase
MTAQTARPERRVPTVPPAGQRVRVVLDTDTANEVDDQYAIALALFSPERIDLKGLVAAHFGDRGGPAGIDQSYDEIRRVLDLAGDAGRVPAFRGSHPLRYSDVAEPSEGVDFIVEEARKATPDDPLWVVLLGPATDVVAASVAAPDIADRMVALFHGRTRWPATCWNFNVHNDVRAARALFHSPLPFVLFDTGTYLRQPLEEAEQTVAPHGPLGRYLVDIRRRTPRHAAPSKGLFDLGDVAFLVDPALAEWEEVSVPTVGWDLVYDHAHTHGRMLRVYHIDRPGTFRLLSDHLVRSPH